ncbi:MAG: hypothetical protein KZQ83_08075 [gamma proteobacterium symbiont of Taylorina sp.]|nr:hypothetical protein [gamma proteobacterium symbiont of Taylorina sp.]
MDRITVTQAARQFSDLLNKVHYQGISVELERSNRVIAMITPVHRPSNLKAKDLNAFFMNLPSLDDDIDSFSKDMEKIGQEYPLEIDEWD